MRIAANACCYVFELLGFVIGPAPEQRSAGARTADYCEVHDYDVLIARLEQAVSEELEAGRAPPRPATTRPARRPVRRFPRVWAKIEDSGLRETLAFSNHPFTERLDSAHN